MDAGRGAYRAGKQGARGQDAGVMGVLGADGRNHLFSQCASTLTLIRPPHRTPPLSSPLLPSPPLPPTQVKHMRATYGSQVVFTLMNSFSTSDDTRAFLAAAHPDLLQVGRGGLRGGGEWERGCVHDNLKVLARYSGTAGVS